jgi:hypothetical protein
MIGFVIIAGAVLLGTTSALLNVANQVSAQITPSASSVNELGFMAQNTTDPVQNTTAANITQLATVLPTVDQPITPTSFAPVSEESDESTSSSNNDDDDDSNSDNNGEDDSGDDDSGDDDSGDGNGGGRSASAGGAFASAG